MWGMGGLSKDDGHESISLRLLESLQLYHPHSSQYTHPHPHPHSHTHTRTHTHTHMTTLIYLQIVPPNVKCHLFLIQVFKHTLSHTLSLSFFQTHNKHSPTHSLTNTLLSFLCSHTWLAHMQSCICRMKEGWVVLSAQVDLTPSLE